MPQGIYTRTEHHIQKLREANNPAWFKSGHVVPQDWRKRMSKKRLGKKIEFTNPILRGKKISESKLGVPHLNQRGKNCHLWKGGVTSANSKIRSSLEYKQWRRAVFVKDDYRCFDCGRKNGEDGVRGLYLQADHILPFSQFPRLRLDINNGRTLCRECHKETDTYLYKIKTWVKN